jgi:hypothetical protein
MNKKQIGSILFGIVLLGLEVWMSYVTIRAIWHALKELNSDLSIALVAGAATILAATITVMLGRHYERKRDIEAHFRTERIKIYDDFLKELFKIFQSA